MIASLEVATNLYIGELGRPFHGEFDSVLTVSMRKPKTDDHLRHRWIELPWEDAEWVRARPVALECSNWVRAQWLLDRKVLVQSAGYAWAELVVASALIHLGASVDEALVSLRKARPEAFADPSFLALLRTW